MKQTAAEAAMVLLNPSAEEADAVAYVWAHLRAPKYYTSEGCRFCGVMFRPQGDTASPWRVQHMYGCNVPLMQVMEEIATLKVVRFFMLRNIPVHNELPLIAAKIAEELDE